MFIPFDYFLLLCLILASKNWTQPKSHQKQRAWMSWVIQNVILFGSQNEWITVTRNTMDILKYTIKWKNKSIKIFCLFLICSFYFIFCTHIYYIYMYIKNKILEMPMLQKNLYKRESMGWWIWDAGYLSWEGNRMTCRDLMVSVDCHQDLSNCFGCCFLRIYHKYMSKQVNKIKLCVCNKSRLWLIHFQWGEGRKCTF